MPAFSRSSRRVAYPCCVVLSPAKGLVNGLSICGARAHTPDLRACAGMSMVRKASRCCGVYPVCSYPFSRWQIEAAPGASGAYLDARTAPSTWLSSRSLPLTPCLARTGWMAMPLSRNTEGLSTALSRPSQDRRPLPRPITYRTSTIFIHDTKSSSSLSGGLPQNTLKVIFNGSSAASVRCALVIFYAPSESYQHNMRTLLNIKATRPRHGPRPRM